LTIGEHMTKPARKHHHIPLTKLFPSSARGPKPYGTFDDEVESRRILWLELDSPWDNQLALAIAHTAETEVAQ
jgi:hypothetical protein